ncbi:tRNA (adenosine(37)-N6)-dimethylallyltransferase MiaA [Peptococcaceae bacterium]|nr:tRNA (adenosine(37)-N6)-dimethylallyltransferase MiaA [Peptococcaceae bacterium]
MKKPLLAVVGPTASGKTSLGVELALKLNGEVVSADSMLVYRYMDIGTAKPTAEERKGVPHHLIDIKIPWEEYNVAQYQKDAKKAILDIYKREKLPILVGGTGLYIRAVTDKYNFNMPGEDKELRTLLQKQALQKGKDWLYKKLCKVDPKAAAKIHPNNVRRVIRVLEVYILTGRRISDMQNASYNSEYDLMLFSLSMPREVLYERIEKRVDIMIERGLVEEVRKLLNMGVPRSSTSMQGLGYKEIAAYLYGEISLERAIELIKRNTRRFAKRQLTWFRRDPRIYWVLLKDVKANTKEIIEKWKEYIDQLKKENI